MMLIVELCALLEEREREREDLVKVDLCKNGGIDGRHLETDSGKAKENYVLDRVHIGTTWRLRLIGSR